MLQVNALRDPTANPGYAQVFQRDRLTLGLMFPIEAFEGDRPAMARQVELAQFAEASGFAGLWFRDVPLRDPGFGDVGQIHDTFVYLGYIAAQTRRIALGTAAVILPHRHPLHTAKAAASVDQLSGGRLILGVASGDRPVEFPAFGLDINRRAELFREHLLTMRQALTREYPTLMGDWGYLHGADVVPKPVARDIPLLVTGRSGQDLEWIARNAHGWMSYPRPPALQAAQVAQWRAAQAGVNDTGELPFAQSLYLDYVADPRHPAVAIHLGYRLGRDSLLALLAQLQAAGVAHVILNLKYGSRPADAVVRDIARDVLPRLQEDQAAVLAA